MNYLLFAIRSAFADFARNKGRTLLTSLGILIGVLAVVLLTAFGLGLKKYIGDQFDSLGANLMFVMPGKKETVMRGGGMMGGIKFDQKDADKVARIDHIVSLAPMFAKSAASFTANGKTEIIDLIGTNEEVSKVMNLEIEEGRLLEKRDIQKGAKFVILHATYAEKLFNSSAEAVGENVDVDGQTYKIIGVAKSKGGGGFGGGNVDANAYVPFKSTFVFNPDKTYYTLYLKVDDKANVEQVKRDITEVLGRRYDEDDFSIFEQTELVNTISQIFGIVNTVLVAIAAISLVVGGIGIMNIMYVTVTERIKEIGIRRALGARKSDVLQLFLIEAIILSVLGGVLGLLLSWGIVLLIQPLFPAYIDAGAVALALGVSSFIGIVFGVFPAKKAADLSPIDAIRYE
jgi:putative ABC transport system permease protein